ncbi:MAG: hypothetical protein Q9181_006331, partial [Wetmoreana brouardii]
PRNETQNPYAPTPVTLLSYLATTILTVHSLPQTLARKKARDLSSREPAFGLSEEKSGIICGLGANAFDHGKDAGGGGGMVLQMEYRRKSGRSVHDLFYLPPSSSSSASSAASTATASLPSSGSKIILLDDHPLFRVPVSRGIAGEEERETEVGAEDLGGTFNLGLTEKQRRDREGVVLPFYDAQKPGEGRGEGGRILYDMGVEDDFDEEEDEM